MFFLQFKFTTLKSNIKNVAENFCLKPSESLLNFYPRTWREWFGHNKYNPNIFSNAGKKIVQRRYDVLEGRVWFYILCRTTVLDDTTRIEVSLRWRKLTRLVDRYNSDHQQVTSSRPLACHVVVLLCSKETRELKSTWRTRMCVKSVFNWNCNLASVFELSPIYTICSNLLLTISLKVTDHW